MLKRCLTCNQPLKLRIRLKLIPTNRKSQAFPKYIPQFKAVCFHCQSYIKFVSQTDSLIDETNQMLSSISLVENRFYELSQIKKMKIKEYQGKKTMSEFDSNKAGRIEALDDVISLFITKL